MKNRWKRLLSASLALVLAGSLALPALADTPETPAGQEGQAELLDVTARRYSPNITVQPGQLYTLIALPSASAPPQVLTAGDLVKASGNALFIGSATANAQGRLTFEDVRLRTAQAAVYYVTGPGLTTPYREATGASTSAEGFVRTASQDSSATITLVDKETDYRYNTGIQAGQTGYYTTGHLAPGKYKLRVEKPGYLPYLSAKETDYLDVTSGESAQKNVDISANVGDVNNDGVRDMTDLAALLTYYGSAAPQDITADLDCSGAVDAADAALLAAHLTTGAQTNVTGASIAVRDGGGASAAGLRYLSFELDTDATVSAAAFSLTFQNHAVQPLTAQGGLMAPVDGGTLASCLLPTNGFTAQLVSWRVEGEQTTLSFAVTSDKPLSAGQVARFYYRPATGSTESFYNGVFELTHAAALVGQDTVVTQSELTYPGCDDVLLDSISIDQKPAPGGDQVSLTIPSAGRTAVLPLSVTGYNGQTAYPDLNGVSWSLDKSYGDHVSINQGLLIIASGAPIGDVVVRAQFISHGDTLTDSFVVALKKTPSVPSFVEISKNSTPCNQDELTFTAGDDPGVTYAAQVYDQYGQAMEDSVQVTWSLFDAPTGLSIVDGALVPDWDKLAARSYRFTLCAQTDSGVQATVAVELTVETKLGALIITGPASATLPAPEAEPLVLSYTVSALDQQGRPMELGQLDPSFTISPMGNGVDAGKDINGNYTVTISPAQDTAAQAGSYVLTAQSGEITVSFALELLAPEKPKATRATIFFRDEPVTTSAISLSAGRSGSAPYTAMLLDDQSQLLEDQSGAWQWSLSETPSAITLPADGATATLTVAKTLAVGSYSFTLTATETGTGLTVTIPVVLTVKPVLTTLNLTAPQALTIPMGETLRYTLLLAAFDAAGDAMDLPSDLQWSVTKKDSSDAPSGVSVDGGTLTVTPDAAPGDITVTATDKDKSVTATAHITLEPAGHDQVLTLYRQITVDGKTIQSSAPVLTTGDAVHIKEGQTAVITYTAILVDQSTNEAVPIRADKVKWVGGQNIFTVDAKAQSGTYSTLPIAVYEGQSAAATAQVTVYPNITDLRLDFGDGHTLEPPYSLAVPAGAPKTYAATVMATVLRDGQSVQLPLSELGLADYALETTVYYTGVYIALDKAAGILRFTVDPVAIQNSMDPPLDGDVDVRVLSMKLDYFPDESLKTDAFPFFLTKEALTAQNAYLRRGVGSGSQFVFDTPTAEQITIPAGSLSNCYALELLDQYNRPLTGQGDVTWTLVGAPKDAQGTFLVTLFDPGQVVENTYSNYASLRRLRVSAATPAGTYPLTLSVTCGDFTRSLSITLEVTQTAAVYAITLSDGGQLTIPRYYYEYNKTTLNDQVNAFPFTLSLRAEDGQELDPFSYTIAWSVTNPAGSVPTGVSIAALPGNAATANVSVDRTAKPTGSDSDQLLRVTATVKDSGGATVGSVGSSLELVRGASVPTVMEVRRNGQSISRDVITLTSTDTVTRDYTFYLWDQYGQQASLSDRKLVSWRISNVANSGVTAQIRRDSDGVPSVRVTIANPSKSVNINLSAVITFAEPSASGGRQTVYATVPLNITVNTQNSGNNGSSSSGGNNSGISGDDENTTAGAPASLTINGGATLSATQGTAATRTFTATLKDANGLTCSFSYDSSVTWSASGLSGGLTFNTSTHVLTVPATVAAGTYQVTITAVYNNSSTVRQSINVTVTVAASSSAATDVTLAPPVSQTGTAGTAALSTSQEQALLATTGVSGGTVTIVPTGGNGLSSIAVSLTSATANAIASQRGQSLRVQTSLGTVVLSPEAVRALAARGGSNVTVTLSCTSDTLKVDFSCGSSAASLPGTIILNASTPGNVALKVNADGSETLLKKALVEEGKLYTYLTGSTQLKLETRSSSFVDTQGHWAKSAIDFTVARELFQGTSATTFDPGGNMTRSMVVTVLHRLEDTPAAAATAQFPDVAQNTWYTAAIAWANAGGIVQGTDSGFKPNDPVTREQLATILYRYVNSLGLSTSQRGSLSGFSDQSKVNAWARDAMEWAVGAGLINGKTGGVLDPGGYASRAEVSTILERLIRSMVPVV